MVQQQKFHYRIFLLSTIDQYLTLELSTTIAGLTPAEMMGSSQINVLCSILFRLVDIEPWGAGAALRACAVAVGLCKL